MIGPNNLEVWHILNAQDSVQFANSISRATHSQSHPSTLAKYLIFYVNVNVLTFG